MKLVLILGSQGESPQYWREFDIGMKAYSQRLGMTVECRVPPDPRAPEPSVVAWQLQNLNMLGSAPGEFVLGVAAVDPETASGAIGSLALRGVPCVTFRNDCPNSGRHLFVGANQFETAKGAGRQMAQLIEFTGKALILTPNVRYSSFPEKLRGIELVCEPYPNMHLLLAETGYVDHVTMRGIVGGLLAENPDIRAIIALDAICAKAAVSVIREAAPPSPPMVFTFGIDKDIADALTASAIISTTVERPHTIGQKLVDVAFRIGRDGLEKTIASFPNGMVDCGSRTVLGRTLDMYRKTQEAFGLPVDF